MSHFSVTVVHEHLNDIEKLMKPYREYDGQEELKPYLTFYSFTKDEEEIEIYNGTKKMVKLVDGSLIESYDSICYKEISEDEYKEASKKREHVQSEGFGENRKFYVRDLNRIGATLVDIPYKDIYLTFEDYIKCCYENTYDEEQQDYGYWRNENGYWDGWRIGGRYRRAIPASQGSVEEVAWEYKMSPEDLEDREQNRKNYYDSTQLKYLDLSSNIKVYNKELRFWEVVVEGQPIREDEDKKDFLNLYKKEYYLERYKTKENYAKQGSKFLTYALLTPDGKWYSVGTVGWWGNDNSTTDSYATYVEFFDKTVKEYKEKYPDYYITVLDCHI